MVGVDVHAKLGGTAAGLAWTGWRTAGAPRAAVGRLREWRFIPSEAQIYFNKIKGMGKENKGMDKENRGRWVGGGTAFHSPGRSPKGGGSPGGCATQ